MKLERQQFIKEYTGFNFNTYIISLDIPQEVKFKLMRLADLLDNTLSEDEMYNIFKKIIEKASIGRRIC